MDELLQIETEHLAFGNQVHDLRVTFTVPQGRLAAGHRFPSE